MGAPELFLELKTNAKRKKVLHLKAKGKKTFLIGSSEEADLRIAGAAASGCHLVVHYKEPHWIVSDVSGNHQAKLDQKNFIEEKISKLTKIQIGENEITVQAFQKSVELYKEANFSGRLEQHQIIVLSKGRVIVSKILPANVPFRYFDGDQEHLLVPPNGSAWKETAIGPRVIRQRLIPLQEKAATSGFEFDQDLKKPLLALIALVLVLTGIVMLIPKSKIEAEPVLTKNMRDMIFNAKTVKKKREESKKALAQMMKAGGNANQKTSASHTAAVTPQESNAPKANPKTAAAINNLRSSGLSALIGKIAKRANKQGVLVQGSGVTADQANSGSAIFSIGKATVGGGGGAAKDSSTFKLGGVATLGKGGGSGNFKEGTALQGGSVGKADVSFIDEETVVEGGLDRDAIADVIKRNIGQVRYCYERQLSSRPDLYGKVLVKFNITAEGTVVEAHVDNSTLKNAMVEGCIIRRIGDWKFPLPKGGTQVRVSYPFLFKALE